MKFIVPLEQK